MVKYIVVDVHANHSRLKYELYVEEIGIDFPLTRVWHALNVILKNYAVKSCTTSVPMNKAYIISGKSNYVKFDQFFLINYEHVQ